MQEFFFWLVFYASMLSLGYGLGMLSKKIWK